MKPYLLVTHGSLLRNMLAYLRKEPLEKVWCEAYKPTALSLVMAEEAKFEIKYWNDTIHDKE